MARAVNLASDQTMVEHNYVRGLVSDAADVPQGGLEDVVDFLVEQPGMIYKRGGWSRQSSQMTGASCRWVGATTINLNPIVVAINSSLDLYNVTTPGTAALVGHVGFAPQENSTQFIDMLILCDPTLTSPPKKITTPGGVVTLTNLGGVPPVAAFSSVYAGRLVLARGPESLGQLNRIWFSEGPFPEGDVVAISSATPGTKTFVIPGSFSLQLYAGRKFTVAGSTGNDGTYTVASSSVASGSTSVVTVEAIPSGSGTMGNLIIGWDLLKYLDTSYPVTGLAAIAGTLLVFSSSHVERILGGIPPAEEGSDMQLQPLAGVGCLDARSIVLLDETVIFAGEEGVWTTNGSGVDSLTEKADGTGIQVFWRSLFPRGQQRQVIGGLINRDFYLVSILDGSNVKVDTLLCHIPTQAWTRISDLAANSMDQGVTIQGVLELYSADPAFAFANRLTDIINPSAANQVDGGGPGSTGTTVFQPYFTTRNLDLDSPTLKSYSFGRLTYEVLGTLGQCQLLVDKITALGAETVVQNVAMFSPTTHAVPVKRGRFNLFGDYQSLSLKVHQNGPSEQTKIFYLEVEARPYPEGSDF